MRTTHRFALSLAGASLLVFAAAGSAVAAEDGTTTTVTVNAGALSVTVPGQLSLSAAAPGGSASGTLAPVTVTDATSDAIGWTATVSLSRFAVVDAQGAPIAGGATFAAEGFSYSPTDIQSADTEAYSAVTPTFSGTSMTVTDPAGNNQASWGASVSLTVPKTAKAGTYQATLTHSVS
ncbi:WxL domain-containing protein [Microbacterium sp. JZ31]|uniref:WxL domain-containing protein n=1 Tax=Microbacterium sp. JZ31 TaxID=1906274 RepID=UPI001934713A|nr:WxL domain-containing protein [Microbacterium sp. JZ31]